MARTQCADIGTMIANADFTAEKGSLLTLTSGKAVLTSTATDVVVAILAEDIPAARNIANKPISVWPINKAMECPVLVNGAVTVGHLLIPTTDAGKAAGVANIAALVANQMAFGLAVEAATADDDVITGHIMTIAGPTA